MALQISATPILTGEEAVRFWKKVKEQENIPVILKSSPKIHESIKYVRERLNRESSGGAEPVNGPVADPVR
ncbi:MAG: hypothetical protein JWO08_4219 [Verrucomicrobiaceae bacterium]|nr:hypothetical protein [Verrucomicrobiaceae bacterium]